MGDEEPRDGKVWESKTSRISKSLSPSRSPVLKNNLPKITKKKRDLVTWDPKSEFEIEKILDHRKYAKNRMLYLVKWKGWENEYNTYEPIENLTHCNYILMKYLERQEPESSNLRKVKRFIKRSLFRQKLYIRFEEFGYRKEDLLEFSTNCLNIDPIFQSTTDLTAFERTMKREYNYVVRCLVGLWLLGQRDEMLFLRGINYKIVLRLISLRCKQLRNLSRSQMAINNLEETDIQIINNVDFERFPDFIYISEMRHGKNIVIPMDPPLGCSCLRSCDQKSNCCPALANSDFAYNSSKLLNIPEGFPIYECNQKCICSKECINRVVQNGRKVSLCIFKTESCGWGVKAVEPIKKGTFVVEYIGELISEEEAYARDRNYYSKKMISYLFDLDFNPDHGPDMYSIDATRFGNLARFINHSCDPNLVVFPVWIDCLDPNLPRLAFFARKNIKKNEEITFDYENLREDLDSPIKGEEDQKNLVRKLLLRLKCECKAPNCRGWLFGNR